MKKKIFSLLAVCTALGMVACNNSSSTTSTTDSTSSTGTTVTNTTTSTGNYSARADSVKQNVSAGNYINPKTGKAYTSITVDPNTGALTDETGQPIRRFVDKRTWWVYDANNWDTIGSAHMKGHDLMYRDASGNWVPYDKRWSDNMDNMDNSNMNNMQSSDSGTTEHNSGNRKVKVSDNGRKIKIKDKGNNQ